MKAYKVEVLIIDHDDLGPEEIKSVIENTRYPNHCMSPSVMGFEEEDIGEWYDGHPLNIRDTKEAAYKELFEKKPLAYEIKSPDGSIQTITDEYLKSIMKNEGLGRDVSITPRYSVNEAGRLQFDSNENKE